MIRRAICWPVTSSRQCTQASDWSLAPDAGLWLAESSVSHCSLSRGANWNEWVLMRVWRQGDTRHNQGASWDQQMEIEIQNKCNHWSFVMWSTLYYFVTLRKSAPVEIYWHLTSSQQFFNQIRSGHLGLVFWDSLSLIITDLFWSNNDKCRANEDRVRPSPDAGWWRIACKARKEILNQELVSEINLPYRINRL